MTRSRHRLAEATAVAASLLAAMAVGPAAQADSNERAGVNALRKLTERYHDVGQALADGFVDPRVGLPPGVPGSVTCVASELGGMGYHFINPSRFDDKLHWKEPEALLYRTGTDGQLELTGVEYLVVDADQDLSTVEKHQIFGHRLFGPMEGHGPGMPRHYDRHAWIWLDNPAGLWSDYNPAVSCP
jgi:hypothetical protein